MSNYSRNKYGARKTVVDGITFDSKREAARYGELKLLEKAGDIRKLRVHPSWPLEVNGVRIGKYTADFFYLDKHDDEIIEDVKSPATAKRADYRLRKKIMEALYFIPVREVY